MTTSPALTNARRLSAPLAAAMVASLLVVSAAASAASLGGHERVSLLHAGAPVKAVPARKEY